MAADEKPQINETLTDNITIKPINLNEKYFNKNIIIASFQIKSPFYDEIDTSFQVSNITKKNYEARKEKIRKILDSLDKYNERKKEKINIVVFPEYSVPEELMVEIKRFVNKNSIIFIGNFYNQNEEASTTFIHLPEKWSDKEVYFANKISQSNYDKKVLSDVSDKVIYKIFWTPKDVDSTGYIQVFTCKDFLMYTSVWGVQQHPQCIDLDNPGIIIIPMSTPDIDTFKCKALTLLRDSNEYPGKKTVVSVLCNATDIKNQYNGVGICGGTQFVAQEDRHNDEKVVLDKGFEGCIIAKINPFNVIVNPSPVGHDANSIINKIEILKIDENHELKKFISPIHNGVIVNPFVKINRGQKKVYALMKHNNYKELIANKSNLKDKFDKSSIGIYLIYGYYDLLIKSYEQAPDDEIKSVIQLRLYPLINDDGVYDNFSYFIVKNPVKIRGVNLLQLNEAEKNPTCCKDYLTDIIDIDQGKSVSKEKLDSMEKNNICLKTKYDLSYITKQEMEENKSEYLVFIDIFGNSTHEKNIELFEKDVLDDFINDEKIRTIERVLTSKESRVKADYIIHIVASSSELNEIVFGKINARGSNNYYCKTHVVGLSNRLAGNTFPVSWEDDIGDYFERQVIYMMQQCKKFIVHENFTTPFAINMLEYKHRERFLYIYRFYEELRNQYYKKDQEFTEELLFQFIYNTTVILSKKKYNMQITPDEIKELRKILKKIVTIIDEKVEESLIVVFKNILKNNDLSEDELNKIINLVIEYDEKLKDKVVFEYNDLKVDAVFKTLSVINDIISTNRQEKCYEHLSNISPLYGEKCKMLFYNMLSYFGQTSDRSMTITIMNLENFSSLTNLPGPSKLDKILGSIPNTIYYILKYLQFINKKIKQ